MKLGYFIMPVHPLGRVCADTIQEDREAFILADKLGYSEAFCGEHLTDAVENIPSSLMFIASLADATKTITLGSAVANLPHNHPVLVASHAAMVDHLLRGRFILGIGAGILRSDAEAVGILDQDRTAMLMESIEQIVALWHGEAPYNLSGKYWNISTAKTQWKEIGLGSILAPFQRPHPPLLGTASDPNSQSMTRIGKKGWLPTSSGFLHPNWLKNHWGNYSSGCVSENRVPVSSDWRIARSIFVANDDKVAEAYGRRDSYSPYRFHMKQLSTKLAKSPAGLRGFKADESMRDEDVTLDYIMDNIVIAGSPNSVVDQILAMHEKTGDFGTLLCVGTDWADKELARTSMTLMAEEVMPAVNGALSRQTPVTPWPGKRRLD